MSGAKIYTVHAQWDAESETWWTDGEDLPGLTCQAETFDQLVEVILDLAPDLLHANLAIPTGSKSILPSSPNGGRHVPPPAGAVAGGGMRVQTARPGKPRNLVVAGHRAQLHRAAQHQQHTARQRHPEASGTAESVLT